MTEMRFDSQYIISQNVIETPFRKLFWTIKAQRKILDYLKIKIAEEISNYLKYLEFTFE